MRRSIVFRLTFLQKVLSDRRSTRTVHNSDFNILTNAPTRGADAVSSIGHYIGDIGHGGATFHPRYK